MEEAHVLDGNDRLAGERLQECDLLVGEGHGLHPAHHDAANRHVLTSEGGDENAAEPQLLAERAGLRVTALSRNVGNVNRDPLANNPLCDERHGVDWPWKVHGWDGAVV